MLQSVLATQYVLVTAIAAVMQVIVVVRLMLLHAHVILFVVV